MLRGDPVYKCNIFPQIRTKEVRINTRFLFYRSIKKAIKKLLLAHCINLIKLKLLTIKYANFRSSFMYAAGLEFIDEPEKQLL